MPKVLEKDDVLRMLRHEVAKAGSQRKWCAEKGVEPATLSRVLSGYAAITSSILEALGLRLVYMKAL
jgi:hypothetical protein